MAASKTSSTWPTSPRPSSVPSRSQGADAFNLRGAVEPIRRFRQALCDVVPQARPLLSHGQRQLPIAPSLDDSRLEATLGPIPHIAARWDRRDVSSLRRPPRSGRVRSVGSQAASKLRRRRSGFWRRRGAGASAATAVGCATAWRRSRKRSLGIGLMSIFARPSVTGIDDVSLKLVRKLRPDIRLVLREIDGLTLFAVGHHDQVEPERSLDGIGQRPPRQFTRRTPAILTYPAAERAGIQQSLLAPPRRRAPARLPQRGRGRSALQLLLDLDEVFVDLRLLSRSSGSRSLIRCR